MRLMDEQCTRPPCYGVCRMTAWLKTRGCGVHHKGVARLMQTMGIETLYA